MQLLRLLCKLLGQILARAQPWPVFGDLPRFHADIAWPCALAPIFQSSSNLALQQSITDFMIGEFIGCRPATSPLTEPDRRIGRGGGRQPEATVISQTCK